MPPSFDEAAVQGLLRQITALQRISSLGVLAGSISHEINNALTPILNYAKLGLRSNDPEYRTKAFERILEASQRASAIASGMLGLARPQLDRHRATDLVRLTEEVLLLAAKDLQKHRVHVEFRADTRPFAAVNAAQIQQVLLNLVINARQAMSDGGALTVVVGTDGPGRLAEIRVSDTGVGIAPEHLRHIFEPFYTTKTDPDDAGMGGTGLGLSVSRDIVAAHKGRIRAESRVGQGSTFTIRLPVCAAPVPATTGGTRSGAA